MFKKIFTCTFFFIFTIQTHCQNISGEWVGNYAKSFFAIFPQKLVIEIFVSYDSVVTGLSHLYYKNNKYEHYTIKGIYNKKDSSINFKEDRTIAVKLGFMYTNCLGIYKMKLSVNDSLMRFDGRWKDKSKSILLRCPSCGVWLEKKITKPKPIITSANNDSLANKPADKNLLRTADIQSLIEIDKKEKDSIKIEIYDNGTIDNDSVSVYFDDNMLINKKRITTNPIIIYISLNKENTNSKLKLVAESVGSIPPCTALMIITTKKSRHEVNLSSNFEKNAMIEFFLKE